MYAFVFYQANLLSESLITHITDVWTLTTVCTLMFYQNTPLSECLITHIARIRTLSTMYAVMCYQAILTTK